MAPLKLWLLFFHYTVYPPDLWVSHPRVGGHFCFLRKKKAPKPKINQLNNPNSQAYISLFFLVFLLDSSFLFPLFLFSLSGYRSVLTEVYILSKFVFQPALIFKQEFIGSGSWNPPPVNTRGPPTVPECLLSPSCLPPTLPPLFSQYVFQYKGNTWFCYKVEARNLPPLSSQVNS